MSILIKGVNMPIDGKEIYLRIDSHGEVYVYNAYPTMIGKAVEVPTSHGRLIDADAFAKTLKDISIRQRYDKLTFDKSLTVDDVLDSVIAEMNASGLDGSKNAPTVIEAEE